jgi:D-inositol-3-phosphate glycosyltransferase
MINFIWPPGEQMLAGTGGSETYTAGQVRELLRRGIEARVVIVGARRPLSLSKHFKGIPFLYVKSKADVAKLEGTLIFVNNFFAFAGRRNKNQQIAVIVHNVIPNKQQMAAYDIRAMQDKIIIATSFYNAQQWALFLKIPVSHMRVVAPFADPIYDNIHRPKPTKHPRLIFAGRLHPEKGIYTLLETLHRRNYEHGANDWRVSIVAAGLNVESGKTLKSMLKAYPYAQIIPAQTTVKDMARVLARHDVLLMPSVFREPFGMLSVEAQHAGCRVVASNIGGIPQTNCGLLTLVKPRHPPDLVEGIEEAIALGTVSKKERATACRFFTLEDSVDTLLRVIEP